MNKRTQETLLNVIREVLERVQHSERRCDDLEALALANQPPKKKPRPSARLVARCVRPTRRNMSTPAYHKCHAYGCHAQIEARFLMCGRHWSQVPKHLQAEVWKNYRPGQEHDGNASAAYLDAARAARLAVQDRTEADQRMQLRLF